jgi:hypothetical protein
VCLTERSHKRPGGANIETEGLETRESIPGWMECMGESWAAYSSADLIARHFQAGAILVASTRIRESGHPTPASVTATALNGGEERSRVPPSYPWQGRRSAYVAKRTRAPRYARRRPAAVDYFGTKQLAVAVETLPATSTALALIV